MPQKARGSVADPADPAPRAGHLVSFVPSAPSLGVSSWSLHLPPQCLGAPKPTFRRARLSFYPGPLLSASQGSSVGVKGLQALLLFSRWRLFSSISTVPLFLHPVNHGHWLPPGPLQSPSAPILGSASSSGLVPGVRASQPHDPGADSTRQHAPLPRRGVPEALLPRGQ